MKRGQVVGVSRGKRLRIGRGEEAKNEEKGRSGSGEGEEAKNGMRGEGKR